MLLSELKEVIEIDSKISSLHGELNGLYQKRARLVEATTAKPVNSPAVGLPERSETPDMMTPQKWAKRVYDQSVKNWSDIGVQIPAKSTLLTKFKKAYGILTAISDENPELAKKMNVILVPPTKKLNLPIESKFRSHQPAVFDKDYIQPEIRLKESKAWKVLLVYTSKHGLSLGDAAAITKSKAYKIAGFDTRGLGLSEYLAMTLQVESVVDQDTCTALLRDPAGDNRVIVGQFVNGRYRVEITDDEDLFGDVTFRPAVEVK